MSDRLYSARVSTFRKEGTRCHLSMLTLEVYAKDEDEVRAVIAEEYEGEEVTIDRIEEIHEDTRP
jgi:hypothetical protein